MKKITDSAVFNQFNSATNIIKTIKNLSNTSSDIIKQEDLPNEFSTINRRINFGTKGKIIECLEKERIIMINDENNRLPKYLSTVGVLKNNKITMLVNLNPYMNSKKEIYAKTLFGLLQNSLISLELSEHWNRYTMHIEFIKNTSLAYSRMITKILDKMFAIDIDSFKSDLLSFVFAKFFLITMCDKESGDIINNIAHRSCFNKTNLNVLLDEEEVLGGEAIYDDIFKLFEALKHEKGLESISIREFINQFARTYGEAAILSLDYLPTFLHTIFSAAINASLVKDNIIEVVAGRNAMKAYSEFIKLID